MFGAPPKKSVNADSVELERVKQKLNGQKERLAELEGIVSAIPDAFYVRDLDYNILMWSDAVAKLTGYTEAEAKKLKCHQMFKTAACPPNGHCPTEDCIATGNIMRDIGIDIYKKNGETANAILSIAGVYDEDGNALGAVEILKDNTLMQNIENSIGDDIKRIDSASDTLDEAMERVTKISQNVTDNTADSISEIKKGAQTSDVVSSKAGESSRYAGSVQESMEHINKSIKFSVEKISDLKEQSEKIINFINIIQNIAKETDLLAINASIEAAHAGEAGMGFKVIADDIRSLSKNSDESVISIQHTLQEISNLIQETTNSINVTEKDIKSGTEAISDILTFVSEIAVLINDLKNNMQAVENTAEATSGVVEEQSKAIIEVRNTGKELAQIARELTDKFNMMLKATEHSGETILAKS